MSNLKRIFLVAALAMTSFSFSQSTDEVTYGPASIDANYCLHLDDASPIQEFYAADASALGWTSEQQAKKMCGRKSNNLISYMSDYANNRILIRVHTDRTNEEKDIAWWNEYLLSLCR